MRTGIELIGDAHIGKYMKLPILLWVLCFVASRSPAQEQNSASERDNALEQRIIRSVDEYANWKRELTSVPGSVVRLQVEARFPPQEMTGRALAARIKLAMLGGRQQIKGIVCELYAKDPITQVEATKKLGRVGGYAAINALSRILINQTQYTRLPAGHYASLRTYAAMELGKLIPELEVPLTVRFGVGMQEQQERDLYGWIESHRQQLVRLQPSDGGEVDQSECEQWKVLDFSVDDVSSLEITVFQGEHYRGRKPHRYLISSNVQEFLLAGQRLDKNTIAALIKIVTSLSEEKPNLSDIGIDARWLAANAERGLAGLPSEPVWENDGKRSLAPAEKRQFLDLFKDAVEMNKVFQGSFYEEPYRLIHDGVKIKIRLKDGECVSLSTEGAGMLLLPWTIRGQEYRKIYDYRLSRMIAALMPKGSPYVNLLLRSLDTGENLRRILAEGLVVSITDECLKKVCPSM